ncbi:MAG TPA: TIR domain-containing protein [Caulobacteraceae bacterium]|nr:TIR domain-containing protein [Caulobacteraceae bacterium]
MSDVFISYARSTARQAQAITEALRALGYSVWRDDDLPSHRSYSDVIEEQLTSAKSVLVIWSAEAVKSHWVRSEADRARADNKLVQVAVDDGARLPMPFDQIQCADLAGWKGEPGHPAWSKVVASIADVVGGNAPAPAPAAAVAAARPAPALPDKPSIAVLPFNNMSGEADQDYLADGIVESITAALSRVRSFFVIARASAFAYRGQATNVCEIGRELGVAYVLEGSVQKAGARIRINVQLIETEGGANVWTGRHDGTLDDIFDLQDRITEQVAGALQPSIRVAEIERARRKRPQDLGAYDYAMRAMPHVWALEAEESTRALDLLDKALAIDPDYPLALSLAAWCHAQRLVYTWTSDTEESGALALKLAERAAELSGDDPLILAVLGAVHTFLHNLGTARILLERAVAIDPNAAWAWSRLAWTDAYSDRPAEAIEKFERALRLSPLDPMNFNNWVGIGSAHEIQGDLDQAIAFYRRGLSERPHAEWLYRHLASALAGAGRMDEAREAYARMLRVYPDMTATKFRDAMVFSPATRDRMVENLKTLGLPD